MTDLRTVTAATYDPNSPTIMKFYDGKPTVKKMTNFIGMNLYIPVSFFPSEEEDDGVVG